MRCGTFLARYKNLGRVEKQLSLDVDSYFIMLSFCPDFITPFKAFLLSPP
jgi:hypothetical protein